MRVLDVYTLETKPKSWRKFARQHSHRQLSCIGKKMIPVTVNETNTRLTIMIPDTLTVEYGSGPDTKESRIHLKTQKAIGKQDLVYVRDIDKYFVNKEYVKYQESDTSLEVSLACFKSLQLARKYWIDIEIKAGVDKATRSCLLPNMKFANSCFDCPIFKRTQLVGCFGTPYRDWIVHHRNSTHLPGYVSDSTPKRVKCSECLGHATRVRKFIESLIPQELTWHEVKRASV